MNTKAAHSPQLFQDPECWSGLGLTILTIGNGSNPSSRKNFDLQSYDRPYSGLLLACAANWIAGTILAIT